MSLYTSDVTQWIFKRLEDIIIYIILVFPTLRNVNTAPLLILDNVSLSLFKEMQRITTFRNKMKFQSPLII